MRRSRAGWLALVALIAFVPPVLAQRKAARAPLRLDGLDAYIQNAMTKLGGVGLAIAIVKDDSIVYAKGFGVKRLGDPAPVTPRTIFAVGSTSKAFTTAALGMLVDEKKLSWDDRVIDRLPGFQLYDPAVTREITVRDIVTHRSGLARGDRLWKGTNLSRADVIRQVRHHRPTWSFRSTWGYQNIMYLAAGELIPAVTGTSWDDFVRDRIFRPLGMSSSSTTVRGLESLPDVATPHDRRDGKVVPIPYRNIDNIGPAGSINSNVLDMAQWIRFHLNGGKVGGKALLEPATEREMFTMQTPMRPESEIGFLYPGANFLGYGLGWIVYDQAGRKMVEHSGGIDGMLTELVMVPSERLGVIALTNNAASFLVFPVARGVVNRLLGLEDDPVVTMGPMVLAIERQAQAAEDSIVRARVQGTRPTVALERYAGEYSEPMYGPATVAIESGKLVLRVKAFESWLPLEHWHYDTFRGAWTDGDLGNARVTFRLDRSGQPTGFSVEGLEYEFTRVGRQPPG